MTMVEVALPSTFQAICTVWAASNRFAALQEAQSRLLQARDAALLKLMQGTCSEVCGLHSSLTSACLLASAPSVHSALLLCCSCFRMRAWEPAGRDHDL